MRVVIENAGAQKAYLILPDETGLLVIAEARVEGQNVYVDLPRGRVGHTDVLPESILNYVRRSHEQVLLADAGEAHPFSTDAYLNRQRPKSLLCLPLLRQTRLIGLLYLENNLITHAFPPGRLALLDLLASQAAISLENARLYTDLQEREARIRRLVESNIIGIFFWNLDGSISEANQAFLQISGYSRHDLLAGAVTWTEITPPEYRAADQRAILELRQAGTCSPYEKEFIRKDGIRIPILVGAALNAGSDDTGVAFVLDLTARRQSEEERAARKSAEAANEAKSAFLATMSHELRSPLNTMLGFGRLLEREAELPLNVREDLRIMLRSGEHLRTLINQVLDMAKIEAGRLVLNETSFDLHFLLEELEDTFALQAVEKGLSLNVELGQTPRFIRGDPVKLRQVLVNLVSNALKFTTQGEVALRAALLDTAAGLCLRFVVTDTGPGIGAAELDRLFIPFVQTGTGQRTPEGTGLGLAISRNFVHLMGGEIHIDSVPGQGTAVRFDIPLQTIGAPAMAVSAAQPRLRVAALAPGQQRFRILAVDDRADARQLLVRLLTPLGFEVREAANGQEAVDISNEWHPHLIWMDMRMPVLDGRTAARRIKTSPEGRAAVIVALTASSFEEERSDILAAGCDDFLRKPVQEEDLFALMEKHLGVRFVYEVEPVTVPAAAVQVGAAALATLPAGLRAALERALVRLDADAIAGVIAEVPNASLAHSLQVLANEFEYGRILEMLRDAGGKETT
jgi:PAS domain S-box-containing protein